MRFDMKRALVGGAAADPNPRTNPGDVPDVALFQLRKTVFGTDTIPTRLLLTLEGTAANTVDLAIWAQDDVANDRGASMPIPITAEERAARKFYLANPVAVVTVTVGELTEFALPVTPGTIYVRVAVSPAADATLKVAAAH